MMFDMKKRVVGYLLAFAVLASGTAIGGQPCLSIGKVSYNGPEASRYLEAGIAQMVETRLKDAGVAISDGCEDRALAISVTLFGGTANLAADLDKVGYHFSRSGTEGELIGFVQLLADEVAEAVTAAVSVAPASEPYQEEVVPAPVPVKKAAEGEVIRSDVFALEVQSVAVGDLDGDGDSEAVAASRGVLQILSVSKEGISEAGRVTIPSYMKPVRLDVLDFDGDGKDELLMTSLHAANQSPLSMVYRHNGTTLVPVGKEARFLSAVVRFSGGGRGCIGQRLDGIDYWGDLFQVTLGEKGLELGRSLDMDESFHVLGWDRAPALKGDETGLFRLSESGRLGYWRDAKTSVYRGDETFGGSLVYLSGTEGDRKTERRRYLESRVQAVKSDTFNGVGVVQMEDALGSLFQGLRRYKSGRVVVVAWNGYELAPVAATPSFKGIVSDFSIADIDGDGEPEVFCSVLNKKGGFSGKSRSYFVLSSLK